MRLLGYIFLVLLLFEFFEARNYYTGGVTPTWKGIQYEGEGELKTEGGTDFYVIKHKIVIPSGYSMCVCNNGGMDVGADGKPVCKEKAVGICLELESDGKVFGPIEAHAGTLVKGMSDAATIDYQLLTPTEAKGVFGDDAIEDYAIIVSEIYETDQIKNIGNKNQNGEFEILLNSCFSAPADILGIHSQCNTHIRLQVNTIIPENEFENVTPAIVRHVSGIMNGKGIVQTTFAVLENSGVEFVAMNMVPFQLTTDKLHFYLESFYHCNGTDRITGIHISKEEVTDQKISGNFRTQATAVETGKSATGHVDVESIAYYAFFLVCLMQK